MTGNCSKAVTRLYPECVSPFRLAVEATQATADYGGVFKTAQTVNRFHAGGLQGQPACTCISAGAKSPFGNRDEVCSSLFRASERIATCRKGK
jgi:hypothetical protein